jgi:hypothetical protein
MPNRFVNPALRPPVYFYHIPKTGGMSLRSFLADQYPDGDRCPAEDWRALAAYDQPALARFRLFYGHLSANLKDYLPAGVRTATFLRSPVGRTVSTIRHLMRDPSFHPMHERFKGRTLREAIYDDELMLGLQNAQTTLLSCDVPIEEMLALTRRQIAENRFVEMGSLQWTSSAARPGGVRLCRPDGPLQGIAVGDVRAIRLCSARSHAGAQPRHRRAPARRS